ncbi:DUF58 domain-containing protein [Acinetobacter sp. S40]|uniref:DUF58 domain-containing protein n=1 Tax=Acinetobacter sp. S40 TaxID=2767434 RepID=UPI00190C9CF0|nr:DUF58 domain-containing protein [Acinetobacter sp. S40]MBJ9984903.1 DUF58 domain-containing protein [Acinetobacter sp. S40]
MLSGFQDWFAKRFRVDQFKTLKQSEILVFIYQQGFLYLALIVITFIAGINYANNLILGFCFLISAVLCMSFYLTFKQLHQLNIEVIYSEVGQVGHPLILKLHCKQKKPTARFIKIKIEAQEHVVLIDQISQEIELLFSPIHRGKFEFPAIQIFSTYPFGLVRAWTYLYLQREIWVAPQSLDLELEYKQQYQLNQHDLEEFRELRNFREGDSFQAISWKQVARGQGLFVKMFENESDQHQFEIDYHQIPCQGHEQKLSWMMALIELCEQRQIFYSLHLPTQQLEHGAGENHAIEARKLLAQA